ncbi:putative short-chain dehydrogenase [Xylariaceae sp. FL0594]|nr:putative short-chain dehydrogenase [Xylariaceae sp. FL0594]
MSSSTQPVWFITGVSNGFGHLLALRALRAGHRVVGTMRNKAGRGRAEAVRRIEDAGGEVLEMDMTESRESIHEKVKSVGKIDYVVNNAGYSIFCCLEQITEQELNTQISTNVFGPVYMMQAALEGMRTRRSGLIINISSIAAKDPLPTNTMYAASKAALEAISESLQREVAGLGISVAIVNPGAFRTNFLGDMRFSSSPLPDEYKSGVVGEMLDKFVGAAGKQPGDPDKAVERIFEFATGTGLAGELMKRQKERKKGYEGGSGSVLRLVLGEDAFKRMRLSNERFVADYTAGEEVALSTAF